VHGDFLGLAPWHLAHPHRRQGAVLQDAQVREQVEVLEHHADFAADRFDLLEVVGQLHAVDDDAPLLVLFQAVEAADGGLARARRPAQHDALALATLRLMSLSTWNWPYHLFTPCIWMMPSGPQAA
jgi:hypothetical protein